MTIPPRVWTTSKRVVADDLGVTLDAPVGWHVRELREPRCLVFVADAQRETPFDSLSCYLGVQFGPRGGLHEAAEAAMARYVASGHPTGTADRVFGRPALVVDWTDGARDLVTWFVEHRGRVLEIHVATLMEAPGAPLRLASELLRHVSLDDG